METLREVHPTARKEHRCMTCGESITPGTEYLRQTNVDAGDLWDYVSHRHCFDLLWGNMRDTYGHIDSWDAAIDPSDFRSEVCDGHHSTCDAARYPHDAPCACSKARDLEASE